MSDADVGAAKRAVKALLSIQWQGWTLSDGKRYGKPECVLSVEADDKCICKVAGFKQDKSAVLTVGKDCVCIILTEYWNCDLCVITLALIICLRNARSESAPL